jgi:hypothetical protein
MSFTFNDLDERTRDFMIAEFESDVQGESLYFSRDFSLLGMTEYKGLMRDAIRYGSEVRGGPG